MSVPISCNAGRGAKCDRNFRQRKQPTMNVDHVNRLEKLSLTITLDGANTKRNNKPTAFLAHSRPKTSRSIWQITRRDWAPSTLIETSQCRRVIVKIWLIRNDRYSGCLREVAILNLQCIEELNLLGYLWSCHQE